jgi:hypothetical protein
MGGELAVGDKLFSFLPHRCQPATGAAVSVSATAMNPGFFTSTGVTRDTALQAIVNRRVLEDGVPSPQHPELRDLRFALVDLTADVNKPKFAGHNETLQGGLGSLAKTACMFAAFQLKFDLEELAKQKSLTSEKALFDAARDVWNDTQKRDDKNVKQLFPSGPKIELLGSLVEIDGKTVKVPRPFSAPDLEQIFTVTPDGSGGVNVRFKGSDLILVDPSVPGSPPHTTQRVEKYVHAGGDSLSQVRKFTFAERLFLMVDESDNAATRTCIENVSFLYLASTLWQNDLYRPERGGGLWEASSHDGGGRWILPPVPRPVPPPVPPGSPRPDFVSATAASVAALFTLLEQDRLVSPKACAGMKQLTSKQKTGLQLPDDDNLPALMSVPSYTRSFFKQGFSSSVVFDRFHSKLGIASFNNDGVIIVRTVKDPADPTKSKQIRYVAAGFDEPLNEDGRRLRKLIQQFDRCIRENNGLLAANAQ